MPAKPGEIRLAEIRPFSFGGKHYVFVVAVTGIFEISELAAEIIRLFVTGAERWRTCLHHPQRSRADRWLRTKS